MASTTPTHVDTSIPELWAKLTLRKTLVDAFWSRFAGKEGSGAVLIRRSDTLGNAGDLVHIQVTDALVGAGVSGDTTALTGSEENLTTSEIKLLPKLYRHGVRRYRRAAKKSIVDLREESVMRLGEWGANKMDAIRFSQFVSTLAADTPDAVYTPNIYCVGGPGTGGSKTDIIATDKLTVASCRSIRYRLEKNLANPVMINGLPFYFLLASPEMVFDLKGDSSYDSHVVGAANRGMDNPVFTGAVANVDGLVVMSHPSVPQAADGGGGSVQYAKALAFGREAFVEAVDEDVTWVEDTFDYEFELGVAHSFSFQPRRALEKNSIQVLCASAAPTT